MPMLRLASYPRMTHQSKETLRSPLRRPHPVPTRLRSGSPLRGTLPNRMFEAVRCWNIPLGSYSLPIEVLLLIPCCALCLANWHPVSIMIRYLHTGSGCSTVPFDALTYDDDCHAFCPYTTRFPVAILHRGPTQEISCPIINVNLTCGSFRPRLRCKPMGLIM